MTGSHEGTFSQAHFDTAYPTGIEHHFWNLARNRILAKALKNCAAQGPMLEIGCGTGVVVAGLRDMGFDCWGSDLGHSQAAAGAEKFLYLGQDCRTLDAGFRDSIRTLLILDVIEHVSDPVGFMTSIRESFPHAEKLLATVPARKELWSNYDDNYGHLRRYDRTMLANEVLAAGFSLRDMHYFFHALYLPMRLLSKSGRSTEIQAPTGFKRIIHKLLAAFCVAEAALVPGYIAGTSIIAVADIRANVARSAHGL